ncbi:hypothetical protein LTR97_003669 [Elasticomyces elasticus]|uniref:Uncharacterized protein n=1 Tax=Elasticomyces elasticus TaxID=574655 RepID=A0AAN8A3V2_9PEZI|nr:hypothetical protein LTR97_003669 [Elasticomyces elasticus]
MERKTSVTSEPLTKICDSLDIPETPDDGLPDLSQLSLVKLEPHSLPPKRSHFMELPAELRVQIYGEVYKNVSHPHEIEIFAARWLMPPPALTMTCRQVREESLQYLQEAQEDLTGARVFYFKISLGASTNWEKLDWLEYRYGRFSLPPVSRFQLRIHDDRTWNAFVVIGAFVSHGGHMSYTTWWQDLARRGEGTRLHHTNQQIPVVAAFRRNLGPLVARPLISVNHPGKLNVNRCLELFIASLRSPTTTLCLEQLRGRWHRR